MIPRRTPLKRTPSRRRPSITGPRREVVELVYERAGYSCEIAGCMVGDLRGIDHHIHHRRPRGTGGTVRPDTNQPQNLLLLCPPHHREVERHREESRAMGWLVPQHADPADVPVLVQRDRWVLLTPDGRYEDVSV